ncbi:MAG: serine/threonine protein kinase [bacterium]|nr:serine/threonine protein kinase [bacterium]
MEPLIMKDGVGIMAMELLGNYRLLKKIGEGGMGTVYLARDVGLEREVAVKIISPDLARSPNLMARFRVEAIAQARLNHSNIVTIHSFEQQKDTYFIVMEYVAGKTLKQMIKEKGSLPVKQVLELFSALLEGIGYAHQKGVLHRDIKPANIFIATDGTVKIADFGIAKVSGIDGLTRAGSTVGTPLYSSPEQIRGEKMGPETDIYSVGVTMYEMLTGVQPFKAGSGSDFEIQKAHLENIPGKPSTFNKTLSANLDAVVMKSLAKTSAARFRSAGAFKKAVGALSGPAMPIAGASGSAGGRLENIRKKAAGLFKIPTGSAPLEESSRKRTLLLILIPLLILLLILIAYSDNGKRLPGNIKDFNKGGINENR